MITVCLATYNGEKYLSLQIDSILSQIGMNDELLISDDGSQDKTIEIIDSYKDGRISLFKNTFRNPVKNFEFLILRSKGDVIFLADQDDIWLPNKVEQHLLNYSSFSKKPTLVLSKYTEIDHEGKVMLNQEKRKVALSLLKTVYSNSFTGCTMSFNSELKRMIMPFPVKLPMHDWWIGLIALSFGQVIQIDASLMQYRRHSQSVTTNLKTSLLQKLTWRIDIISAFIIRLVKLNNSKKYKII